MWYEILEKLTFEITSRGAWRGRRPDSIQKLSGNEVYCTNASLLLMNNFLRSKLHHRIFQELKLVFYKIREGCSLFKKSVMKFTVEQVVH
jgi:hypothetical protein